MTSQGIDPRDLTLGEFNSAPAELKVAAIWAVTSMKHNSTVVYVLHLLSVGWARAGRQPTMHQLACLLLQVVTKGRP